MDWLPGLRIFRSPLQAPLFSARQRGILAHLCLEHLHLDPGKSDYLAEAEQAVALGMRLFPLSVPEPERVATDLTGALAWFAALPEAPYWLRHGLREQGIMDETGRLHRVDLVVDKKAAAGEESPLLVLDYKTGSARSGDATPDGNGCESRDEKTGGDGAPEAEDYVRQVRRYMKLLSEATGRKTEGLLVYLDERRIEPVTPEQNP